MKKLLAVGLLGLAGMGIFCGNVCYAVDGENPSGSGSGVFFTLFVPKNIHLATLGYETINQYIGNGTSAFDNQSGGEIYENGQVLSDKSDAAVGIIHTLVRCPLENTSTAFICACKETISKSVKVMGQIKKLEQKDLYEIKTFENSIDMVKWELGKTSHWNVCNRVRNNNNLNLCQQKNELASLDVDREIYFVTKSGNRTGRMLVNLNTELVDKVLAEHIKDYDKKSEGFKCMCRRILGEKTKYVNRASNRSQENKISIVKNSIVKNENFQ